MHKFVLLAVSCLLLGGCLPAVSEETVFLEKNESHALWEDVEMVPPRSIKTVPINDPPFVLYSADGEPMKEHVRNLAAKHGVIAEPKYLVFGITGPAENRQRFITDIENSNELSLFGTLTH